MKWQALCATRSRAHRKTFREKHTQLSVAASLQKHGSVGSQFITFAREKRNPRVSVIFLVCSFSFHIGAEAVASVFTPK